MYERISTEPFAATWNCDGSHWYFESSYTRPQRSYFGAVRLAGAGPASFDVPRTYGYSDGCTRSRTRVPEPG